MRDFEFNGLIELERGANAIIDEIPSEYDLDEDDIQNSLDELNDDLLEFIDDIKSHSNLNRKELIDRLSRTYKLIDEDENKDEGYNTYYFQVGDAEIQLDINKEGEIKYIDAIAEINGITITVYLNNEIGIPDYF